jgi:hypothetical protein
LKKRQRNKYLKSVRVSLYDVDKSPIKAMRIAKSLFVVAYKSGNTRVRLVGECLLEELIDQLNKEKAAK